MEAAVLNELAPFPRSTQAGAAPPARPEARAPAVLATQGASVAEARDPGTVQQLAVEPALALDRAAKAAARAVFEQREVEVTSFHDEGTGRVVYRVADLKSGEVLLQTPPDALLRFFASTREALAEPLVAMIA
jgi:hypothetical protein